MGHRGFRFNRESGVEGEIAEIFQFFHFENCFGNQERRKGVVTFEVPTTRLGHRSPLWVVGNRPKIKIVFGFRFFHK